MCQNDIKRLLPDWMKQHGYIVLLSCLTVICYLRSFSIGFISDDFYYVGIGHQIDSWESFTQNMLSHGRFIPMQYVYFSLTANLFSLSSSLFHIPNLLLHIINGILVYKIILAYTNRWDIPLIGAILFVGNYKGSSVVIWISNAHGLMVTAWYLATILMFLHWFSSKQHRFYILSLFTFVMALLTKEDAVSLLPVLMASWLIGQKHLTFSWVTVRAYIQEFTPFMILLAIYLYIHTWLSMESGQGYVGIMVLLGNLEILSDSIINFLQRLKWFTAILFLPEFMYGTEVQPDWIKYSLSIFKFIVLSVCGILLWLKGDRGVRFFIAFTFLSMSQYLLSMAAPRYVYLPSIGSNALFAYVIIQGTNWFSGFLHHYRKGIVSGIISVYLIINTYEIQQVIHRWQRAGDTVQDIFIQLKNIKPLVPSGSRLYFIGLPFSLDNSPYVYVIHNGLNAGVQLIYDDMTVHGFHAKHDVLHLADHISEFVFEYSDGKLVELTPVLDNQ